MSCNNWESGRVTLPSKEFVRVRNALIEFANRRQLSKYEAACKLRESLLAKGKGKRGFLYEQEARQQLRFDSDYEKVDAIMNSLFPRTKDVKATRKPLLPRKNNFPMLAQTKAKGISFGEAGISIDNKTKSFHWHTGENNRAVESAREHPIGAEFLRMLKRVTYTSKTGGYFKGNDEYNQEDDDIDGGGTYLTETFGAYADKDRSAYWEVRNMRMPSAKVRKGMGGHSYSRY